MSEKHEKSETVFFPNFLFREAIAALIIVAVVVTLALVHPMKVGDPADPSDSSFKPRPEWYFMAPFYMLKIFPSSLEIVPTVVGPALLFIVLMVFPFFDTKVERSPTKRPVAMVVMVVSVLLTVVFTVLGLMA